MKNIKLFLVIVFSSMLIISACKKENENENEDEPIEDIIYQSSLVNPSFIELQNFYEAGYNIINGNVEFHNIYGLLNMLTLSNVKSIKGSFIIENNSGLISFEGLANLQSIGGDLDIHDNYNLTNLEGLNNLQFVGSSIHIWDNNNLSDLCGITKLLTQNGVGSVSIEFNLFNPSVEDIINGNCSKLLSKFVFLI